MASCIYTNPQAKWNDAKWNILQKILCALNAAGSGGGSGIGQFVAYTDGTDPSLIPPPANTSAGALAYAKNGTTATYGWNVDTQSWN